MAKINPNDIATLGIDIEDNYEDDEEHNHDFSICADGDWFCKICGASMSEEENT